MSAEKRPGGLTALAVLNFIFASFSLLGVFGMILFLNAEKLLDMPESEKQEFLRARQEAFGEGNVEGIILFAVVASVVQGALLLLSGIGYLKQKRFLGRNLGTAYGFVALLGVIVSLALFSGKAGEFGISTMIGLIYPILTIVLLNTTFKEDLTN